MSGLELTPTADLVAELQSRHDHSVIVCMKDRGDADGSDLIWRYWEGRHHACLGLLVDIQERIVLQLREVSEDIDDVDDEDRGDE